MRHWIATACALGLAAQALSQAPQNSIATYDARPLLRAFEITDPPHRLPLHAAFAGGATARDERRLLDEDRLMEFLRNAIGDRQGAEIDIRGGQVFVRGPEDVQDVVAALMNHLSGTLLQEATILIYALPPVPESPAGVLKPAEVDRILSAKIPPVELARTQVILGQPCRLRAGRATSFVSDYDVEVAQSAAISDPVIRVLQEGLDFQASVGLAADGRLVVKFGCTRCVLAEPLTPRTVASTRLGDIQLPKVRSTVLVASGLVEDGGALVTRHDGGLGSGTLVRVRRSHAPPRPAAGLDHHVVFAEDLLGVPLRVSIPSVREDQRKSGEEPPPPIEPLTEPAEDGALTREMIDGVVRFAVGDDEQTDFDVIGSRLHVRGTEEKVAKIRDALGGLAKGMSRNVLVEFRIGRIDAAAQPLPADLRDLVPRLATAVSVPVSLSDQFLIAGGLEQSAIIDQDVEIAQQAQIADPIVAALFTGYVLSGVASAADPDKIELLLDLQHQEVLPWPNVGFPSRAENVGPVDLPQVDATFRRQKLMLEPNVWSVVIASNPGESSTLVIMARASW